MRTLTEKQQMFLQECENEFKNRFTERDAEFGAFYRQEPRDPPIVDPWMTGGGNRNHNYRNDQSYRNDDRRRYGRGGYNHGYRRN
ncbi:uncharacterized protein DMENIID0001_064770 [Sergentomyia squamirostris]